MTRRATCRCGQLSATATGDPVRISVCHCLNCKRRSGSAFSAQARWPTENVVITGDYTVYEECGDSGAKAMFRFCPTCGATVVYENETMPETIAIAIGAFEDPAFPAPFYSVYEDRKHAWVEIVGDDIERYA